MYYDTGVPPVPQQQPRTSQLSNNLSELDQLLQDLNSAQFMAEVDKRSSGNDPGTNFLLIYQACKCMHACCAFKKRVPTQIKES